MDIKPVFQMADTILFVFTAISVIYVFIFSSASSLKKSLSYKSASKKHKFLVIIPSYKDDKVIRDSVESVLASEYPSDKIELIVVSDKMEDETNDWLSNLPLTLFTINPEKSSKAYALNFAISNLNDQSFDIVVILDSDNVIDKDFFTEINNAFYSGSTAVQTHRRAKNTGSDIALLDAISEEINNSIFRKGHVNLGFSSALIGSGMAFSYRWFAENVSKLSTVGEDKEMELLLLKEGIFIDYLDHVYVYDEKTRNKEVFYNQRRRWIAAQLGSLVNGLKDLPWAIFSGRIDYLDKIFQWTLLPRVITLGLIIILAVVTVLIEWQLSVKWFVLFLLITFSFALSTPDYLVTKESIKSIRRIPLIFILMVFNLFRLRGANRSFIHTKKGD